MVQLKMQRCLSARVCEDKQIRRNKSGREKSKETNVERRKSRKERGLYGEGWEGEPTNNRAVRMAEEDEDEG